MVKEQDGDFYANLLRAKHASLLGLGNAGKSVSLIHTMLH